MRVSPAIFGSKLHLGSFKPTNAEPTPEQVSHHLWGCLGWETLEEGGIEERRKRWLQEGSLEHLSPWCKVLSLRKFPGVLGLCRQVFFRFHSVEFITFSVNFLKQQDLLENGDSKHDFSECGKVD